MIQFEYSRTLSPVQPAIAEFQIGYLLILWKTIDASQFFRAHIKMGGH
jgi:hypothetical protein